MRNERITEDIVRTHFKRDPLYNSIKIEEQRSINSRVAEMLKNASKSGSGNIGMPEFLISFPIDSNYLIVIECKADIAQHGVGSGELGMGNGGAVAEVLHYAKALAENFDVIAIAVSGQNEQELLVSHFLWKKGEETFSECDTDKKLLAINDYLKIFENEQFADRLKFSNIVAKAIKLNEEYNDYSISEQDRNMMVSVILLSLTHKPFCQSYSSETSIKSLGDAMLGAVEHSLKLGEIRNKEAMLNEFKKIFVQPIFNQEKIKNKKENRLDDSLVVLKNMIHYLHQNIYPLTTMEDSGFDVLGQFYTEFLRYAGSSQKQGIVLTPFHITDLFCDLAQLNANDIVYDPCCGTAGFLVSAMKRMLTLAGNDNAKKIKQEQIIGVELQPSMYTYACSNMLLKGDGKSNIYCGDCFQNAEDIKNNHKPTVAFLNPPYNVGNVQQMQFIEHALKMVEPQNGRVVAIVQMSCAIKLNNKELIATKNKILDRYHLKAVLSMGEELFYPVSVVTSIMVFETGKINKGLETWFGYFRDDKFEKRKNQGRIDAKGLYKQVKEKWIDAFYNSREIEGLSVKKEVTGKDEWCAEAYMETDYSTLCDEDFIKKIKEYAAFIIKTEEVKND